MELLTTTIASDYSIRLWRLDVTFGIQQVMGAEAYVVNLKHAHGLLICCYPQPDVYGSGHSEKIISKVLKGRRQEVFLATKFAVERSGSTAKINGSPEYLTKACDASLERLGTDYIDLYYCHRIDPNVYVFSER
jgi:predicted oxidoreductase